MEIEFESLVKNDIPGINYTKLHNSLETRYLVFT